MNKRILMICYYFPPLLDVGCKRSVAFSKYLKSHGWEPRVLSVRNPDQHYCLLGSDSTPSGVPVTYVRTLFNLAWLLGKLNGLVNRIIAPFGGKLKRNFFYDLFCIPDLFLGWIPGAFLGGYRIIRKYNIDFIYISCSPFSSAIVGMLLKKISGKPLIIDFRDPMAVNIPDYFGVPGFRKRIDIRLERKIIECADIFVVNTEEVRKGYIASYPEIADKTIVIHNGFDSEQTPVGHLDKYEKFTVVYGGNMYLNLDASESFFEAIALLKQNEKITRENFQFLYFGHDHSLVRDIAEKHGVSDFVHVESTISHTEMLKVLMMSHLQLLRIIKPMISTKLFEGISLNLPFLATIPQGEVADIIAEYSPASYVVHEDSPELISSTIVTAMHEYREGKVGNNKVSHFLNNFSREKMASKLEYEIEKKFI